MTRQAREQFVATLAMLLTLAAGGDLACASFGGISFCDEEARRAHEP